MPITVDAYGSERQEIFIVKRSENPKGIPIWIWVAIVLFIGWRLRYLYLYWTQDINHSFFCA